MQKLLFLFRGREKHYWADHADIPDWKVKIATSRKTVC
jgi:hypothetical protein